MKKFKPFLTGVMLCICSTAIAQYDYEYDEYGQPVYNHAQYNSYSDDDEEGWGTFYVEYSPMQMVSSAKDVDNRTYHSATLGVSYAFQLGYNSPAYLEGAFETTGAWFSKRFNDGIKYNMDIYYSKILLNLAFRLNLADGFAIVPFGGVNLKYNIYGEEREKDGYGTDTWRLFDDDYTYDDDYKRFQFGYQAGLKLIIGNCFSIGASWKADLTPFCKYYDSYTKKEETEKFSGFSFSLGYSF